MKFLRTLIGYLARARDWRPARPAERRFYVAERPPAGPPVSWPADPEDPDLPGTWVVR